MNYKQSLPRLAGHEKAESEPGRFSIRFRNPHVYLIIFACTLLCLFVTFGVRVLLAGSYITELRGIEANVVYSIQALLESGRLYTDPGFVPFSITQYTPLYYYLCAGIAKILMVNPVTDIHSIYVIGRASNILINLISALAVFLSLRKLLQLNIAVSAIAAFSSFVIQYGHDYSVRPDSLHDCFALWSVFFIIWYLDKRNAGVSNYTLLVGAITLAVLSIFAKQSGIQYPIIILGFLLFTADWRGFWTVIISFTVIGGALLLLFIGMYGGAFFENVIGGIANGISFSEYARVILRVNSPRDIPFVIVKLLIPAGIALYFSFYRWRVFKGNLLERFLSFCTLSTLAFATVTALKVGSTMQYYYVSQVLTMMLVICCLWGKQQEVAAANNKVYTRKLAGGFLMLLILFQTAENVRMLKYDFATSWRPETVEVQKISGFLLNQEKLHQGEYVFANVASFDREGINNYLYGYSVVPQLEILEFSTDKLPIFGYKEFEKHLKDGSIKYIVESDPKYEFALLPHLQVLEKIYYQPVMQSQHYIVYKYKGKSYRENNFSRLSDKIKRNM